MTIFCVFSVSATYVFVAGLPSTVTEAISSLVNVSPGEAAIVKSISVPISIPL